MEHKIGEIFEYNGEWYQCVEHKGCYGCAFLSHNDCGFNGDPHCVYRSDGKHVIFKKLEKVGEPYIFSNMSIHNITMQRYKVFTKPIFTDNSIITTYNMVNDTISIEIKNKGNMKMKKVFMNSDDRDYLLDRLEDILHDNHCLEYKDEICNSLCKYIASNNRELKPFNLEAAKAGKPVYTRDGRKARIICFDKKEGAPIVALVEVEKNEMVSEEITLYYINGRAISKDIESKDDLMMLTEKNFFLINRCIIKKIIYLE